MDRVEIDLKRLEEKEAGHRYLKEAFGFPEYYGNNLDALHDCLTERGKTSVILLGIREAKETARRFLRVFEDAAEENPRLHLVRAGEYQLIALDMDGTALTSDKRLDEVTIEAIHHALRSGKEVVFSTGRPVAEMREFLAHFPEMKYLLCESGALLYDLQEERPLYRKTLPEEVARALGETARGRDVCAVAFCEGKYVIDKDHVHRLAHFEMGEYQASVERIATVVDELFDYLEQDGVLADKINLFHTSAVERDISERMMRERELPLIMAATERSSLECTPLGVDKGFGMGELSKATGIPLEEMIVVGDGDNDLEGLKVAGLSIAMGNANENVKAISHAPVSDNDHWGCAEAIVRYLMGVY